jgi:hypothetical protein
MRGSARVKKKAATFPGKSRPAAMLDAAGSFEVAVIVSVSAVIVMCYACYLCPCVRRACSRVITDNLPCQPCSERLCCGRRCCCGRKRTLDEIPLTGPSSYEYDAHFDDGMLTPPTGSVPDV